MTVGIVVSALVIIVGMFAGFAYYRRRIEAMKPDTADRAISGARLTAERLRELPAPPWRVVYEIGAGSLGSVDHVVLGSGGAIAIETVFADRPTGSDDPLLLASAAVLRSEVADFTEPVGVECAVAARVYWGTPQPDLPAGVELAPGFVAVDGQRLIEWLAELPAGGLAGAQIDLGWQAVVTGIGRPDPLG